MITFNLGHVPKTNATVIFGKDLKDASQTHEGFSERDAEGNIEVTIDALQPPNNEPVHLVLHKEKDAKYTGTVVMKDGKMVFRNQNGT